MILFNKKDWLDIIGTILPILLSVVIIIQNRVFSYRTNKLEKYIYNRDQVNRYRDDILAIYNTYYEFCDTIIASGFCNSVETGNVNEANLMINKLNNMKMLIGKKLDLSKLLFGKNNKELYDIVEDRFELAKKIIDKYLTYIYSGKLLQVSENAWGRIISQDQNALTFKYNYIWLTSDKNLYNDFVKLCQSEELNEIHELLRAYHEKHSYENFDIYFESFLSLDKI